MPAACFFPTRQTSGQGFPPHHVAARIACQSTWMDMNETLKFSTVSLSLLDAGLKPMRSLVPAFSFVIAAGLFAAAASAALPEKDWPTFRGADRTAVSKETGLLQTWPESGPP